MRRIWNFFSSVYLTVILAILICMDAAWGSIVSMKNPGLFRAFDQEVLFPLLASLGAGYLHLTLWVYVLIALTALFAVNTFVCTVDRVYAAVKARRPWPSLYPQLVHIGFLIALLGHLAGSVLGFRSYGHVVFKGDAVAVPGAEGLSLRLDDTETRVSAGGELEAIRTSVTLLDAKGGEIEKAVVGLNSPLIYRGIAFYHFDQGESPSALVLSVDGSEVTAELEGAFSAPDGTAFMLGEIYPDFAIGEDGKAHTRSGEFVNPHIEIINGAERAYLPIGAPGKAVTAGGHSIALADYVYSPYVIFTINKDPGIGFIIAGSTVLVAGMLLLLFSRSDKTELLRRGPEANGGGAA